MKIKEINLEKEYKDAMEIASRCFDNEPEPNTPEGDEFDRLLTLIGNYEAKNFPIN
jgi:HTH-type transcriptional regulator/antitoxin HigA